MGDDDVRLRPFRGDDFWLIERQALDPEAVGAFNWSGFKDVSALRRQFDQNGFIGSDDGMLVVLSGSAIAGKVAWSRNTYGIPQWWCWCIGISLLPDFRRRGIGTQAQLHLVNYLFDTTVAERIEALTDVDNHAEQHALKKVGFAQEGRVRAAQFRDGRWRDVFLYSILRADINGAQQVQKATS